MPVAVMYDVAVMYLIDSPKAFSYPLLHLSLPLRPQ